MKHRTQTSVNPKPLVAIQTSRHFRMSHHRHTGRVLPRASTSYPMLVMIVLCVGVLLGGWTHIVTADTGTPTTGSEDPYGPAQSASYVVHGSVPAPAPTVAATIDDPIAETHFTATPIIVSGSCPVDPNGGYVSLYRNSFYSGSAICEADGSYQISIDLFAGANQLVARDYNFTDVAGPDSQSLTVYYDPPSPPVVPGDDKSVADTTTKTSPTSEPGSQGFSISAQPVPSQATTPSVGNTVSGSTSSVPSSPNASAATSLAVPLSLSTKFTIRGYYVGQQSIWQLNVAGGTAPYALAIDWGDGSNGIVSRGVSGETRLTHTYVKPGGYHGSYVVKFTATDAAGNQTFLQLLVIVNSRQPSTVGRTSQSGGGASFSNGTLHFLGRYIWPSYGVVTLMLFSFWLGERRELRYLKPRLKRAHHA